MAPVSSLLRFFASSLFAGYCKHHKLELQTELGRGLQGVVYSTSRRTAIKIHASHDAYTRERDAYQRLAARRVEIQEKFGEDWPAVQNILNEFDRQYGVILSDVHPGNMRLRS